MARERVFGAKTHEKSEKERRRAQTSSGGSCFCSMNKNPGNWRSARHTKKTGVARTKGGFGWGLRYRGTDEVADQMDLLEKTKGRLGKKRKGGGLTVRGSLRQN